MASKQRSVKQLAEEAKLDIDEALILLWDAGFDNVIDQSSRFGRQELNSARRAIGLATRRDLKDHAFWMALFDMDEEKYNDLLCKLGVQLKGKARKVQKKEFWRLKAEARKRGLDPITGQTIKSSITTKDIVDVDFEWRCPGHIRELNYLNEDDVSDIYWELVRDYSISSDPIEPPGIRSESLFASALFRPQTRIGDTQKYTTVETSAAALLHSIIHNHPFHNGNKRTALVSMLVFLDNNGFFPTFNQDEIFKLVLQVAQHSITDSYLANLPDREVLAIADWLCGKCRPAEKGEMPISFHRLRRILTSYGCDVLIAGGSKANITRTITRGRFFKAKSLLQIQISYNGIGREVHKNTINKIRKSLCLDDNHGIDSYAFYSKEPLMATDFIAYYSKTLDRLAKL